MDADFDFEDKEGPVKEQESTKMGVLQVIKHENMDNLQT